MPITEAQARRALRHADIPWDAEVDDPREGSWVVHDHQGLLGGLAAAFAVGRFSLRRAEDFFADLGLGARRALGLGRGVPCDTTLYRLLAVQSPVGFEESVFAQVKGLIPGRNQVLRPGEGHAGVAGRVDDRRVPRAPAHGSRLLCPHVQPAPRCASRLRALRSDRGARAHAGHAASPGHPSSSLCA